MKEPEKDECSVQEPEQETSAFGAYLVRAFTSHLSTTVGYESNIKQRIFRYGASTEYTLQLVATACALGSGVGMALVNLVFGQFITLITDYTSGLSEPSKFRNDAGRLRYVQ